MIIYLSNYLRSCAYRTCIIIINVNISNIEKDIIIKRRLIESPKTLEDLSQEYNVSRERIRQIESRAFEKLQECMRIKAQELKLIT